MSAYALASSTLYPGLFSDNVDAMQSFYGTAGLRFMERLRQSDTYAELFFELPGGKLKIQADTSRPMERAVSGYRALLVATDAVTEPTSLRDPDGTELSLVPYGHQGVTSVGFVVDVPDIERYTRFLVEGMGAHRAADGPRVGDTQFLLREVPDQPPVTPICRKGFTYITLIVHDLQRAHDALVEAGGEASLGISRLHDRCVFAFVRDVFGNWIEVVQYANLSGPLPDLRMIEDHLDRTVAWREDAVPF